MSGFASTNALALLLAFLPGVAGKGRPQMLRQPGLIDELFKLLDLAVRERVHRVDHDRARAARLAGRAGTDRRIDDRHEEAERLAGAGAGGHDKALSRDGFRDSLRLMAVKRDRASVNAEDVRRFWVQ